MKDGGETQMSPQGDERVNNRLLFTSPSYFTPEFHFAPLYDHKGYWGLIDKEHTHLFHLIILKS